MDFIGQPKLLEKLNKLTLDSLPQSLFLIGERGCGKHTFYNLIVNQLQVDSNEITSGLNDEDAALILDNPLPTIYLVNVDELTPKAQATLLKIVEEPTPFTFFILLCTSVNKVLPTLLNRCKQWVFEEYTKEDLSKFLQDKNKDIILSIAKTPGQVIELQSYPVEDMMQLANDMITKMSIASPSSALHISDRMGFKNEKDKFNPSIFLDILKKQLLNFIEKEDNILYINMYKCLLTYYKKKDLYIVSQRAFDNLLISLWEASRAA